MDKALYDKDFNLWLEDSPVGVVLLDVFFELLTIRLLVEPKCFLH